MSIAKSLALCVVAFLCLPGCQSDKADTRGLVGDGFPAPSREMVYQAAVRAVQRQGFSIDPSASSVQGGVVESVWYTSMQPFAGKGRRDKITVRIQEVPERASYYRVETNVIRETNTNLKDPSNVMMAEWDSPTRVGVMENLITRTIEMEFLSGEPSAKFRRRYDLPEGNSPRIRAPVVPEEPERSDPLFGGIGG
jgi:hypothetical protein